jgi:transcriptional regulator with XRE-family HTH domain
MAAFRAAQGWSQAELARRIGISQGFVAQVESGRKNLGLAPALALERLTADWSEGPIEASEWVHDEHPSNVTTPETPDEAA